MVLRLFSKFPFFFLMHHFTDFLFTISLVFGFIMLVIFAWLFLFSGCLVSGLVLGLVGLVFTVAFGVFWFLGGHFNTWNAFFLVWFVVSSDSLSIWWGRVFLVSVRLGLEGGSSKFFGFGGGFCPFFGLLLVSSLGAISGGGKITFFGGAGMA